MELNEKVLLYHLLNQEIGKKIALILSELNIEVIEIKESDVNQKVGYLIGYEHFEKSETKVTDIPEKEMMLFFNFSDDRLTLILDLLKQVGIPFIPLKAGVTPTNIEWSFYDLYHHVKKEYESIYQTKLD